MKKLSPTEEVVQRLGTTVNTLGCFQVRRVDFGSSYVKLTGYETADWWSDLLFHFLSQDLNCRSFIAEQRLLRDGKLHKQWVLQFRGGDAASMSTFLEGSFLRARVDALRATKLDGLPRQAPTSVPAPPGVPPTASAQLRSYGAASLLQGAAGFKDYMVEQPDEGAAAGEVPIGWLGDDDGRKTDQDSEYARSRNVSPIGKGNKVLPSRRPT